MSKIAQPGRGSSGGSEPPHGAASPATFSGLQLAELFEQAPGFVAVLGGRDHRIELANPGYLQLVGWRPVVGRTVAEALPDAVAQGYLDILDRVFETGEAFRADSALYAVQAEPGGPSEDHYVDFVFQPIRKDDGAIGGIFVQGSDVTQRVEEARRHDALIRLSDHFQSGGGIGDFSFAAGEILGVTLDVSRVGYGTIDADSDTLYVDRDWVAPGVETLQGATPLRDYGSFIDSLKLGEFINIGDVRLDPRTEAASEALEGRSARSFVNVPVLEAGRLVAVLFVNSDRARDWSEGELAFVKEVAVRTRMAVERARSDASLVESEAHLKLMVLELNHRVKNNLTMVQSLAAQTLKGDQSLDPAREAFLQRISALAVAHDILTREQWEGLSIEDIARGVLEALDSADHIQMSGPRVDVTPKAGLALAMALHELGTNALKYGALSTLAGRVSLAWTVTNTDDEVTLRWEESGGPPVSPPNRRGFGSRLLERGLAGELGGSVRLAYPPTGVTCTIQGPIRHR